MSGVEMTPEAEALVARLMQQSASEYQAVTQQLIEALQYDNAKLTAELQLIRENISKMLDAPYVPNTAYLRNLLWPSREEIIEIVDRDRAQAN